MKFFEAWTKKGLHTRYRSQWSALVDKRFIFTVWNNPFGETEVIFRDGRSLLDIPAGDWSQKSPGKDYIARAKACMELMVMGEVILIEGNRTTSPSQTNTADIRDSLFYVVFTEVQDNGRIRGVFMPRSILK